MGLIRLNDIRVSGRLRRLQQGLAEASDPQPVYLYRQLAADRINIAFLYLDFLRSPGQITCLVAPETQTRLTGGDAKEGIEGHERDGAVGLISLFPHRFHPSVMGAVFCALNRDGAGGNSKGPGWHCMATSGSMLTLVTDFSRREQIVKAICRYADLPADRAHTCAGEAYDAIAKSLKNAPETVARYQENRIQTYGIQVTSGLTVCSAYIRPDALGSWGRTMIDLSNRGARFAYAAAAVDKNQAVGVHLVLDPKTPKNDDLYILAHMAAGGEGFRVEVRENAEMISFHGPHFGDRYGIADKALGRLGDSHIPVWMAGCVGATVSVVLPPDTGAAAAEALLDIFITPQTNQEKQQHGGRHERNR